MAFWRPLLVSAQGPQGGSREGLCLPCVLGQMGSPATPVKFYLS